MATAAQFLNFAHDAEQGFPALIAQLELAEDLLLTERAKEGEEIVRSVLWVVFALKMERQFFEALYVRDLRGFSGPIFREMNISLIVLRQLFGLLKGDEVIAEVLKDVFVLLSLEGVAFTPLNLLDTVVLLLYRFELCFTNISHASKTLQTFFSSIGWAFHLLGEVLENEGQSTTPMQTTTFLNSIFTLRFISPAICTPVESQLVEGPLTSAVGKRFVQVAKLLQAIANNRMEISLVGISMSQYFTLMNEKTRSLMTTLTQFPFVPIPVSDSTLDAALATLAKSQKHITMNMNFHWEPERTILRQTNLKTDQHYLKVIRTHQKRTYGFVLAPLEPHSMIPPLFGVLWSAQFEIAAVEQHVSNLAKEVLQVAVSYINKCTFCVEMHTAAAMGMDLPYSVIHPLVRGKSVKIGGLLTPKMINIVSWGRVSNVKDHPLVKSPPFTKDEAAEVFAAAFLKHYFNRITNSFLSEFTKARGTFLKARALQKKSESTRAVMNTKRVPGSSFQITNYSQSTQNTQNEGRPNTDDDEDDDTTIDATLSTIEPPSQLTYTNPSVNFLWASSNPFILNALERWQEFENKLMLECVPPIVADRLHTALRDWNGVYKFSEQEMDSFVSDLPPAEAALTRMVVTIAQTPEKVSSHLRNSARACYPAEIASICVMAACSFAAFSAAKKISSFWKIPGDHHTSTSTAGGLATKSSADDFTSLESFDSDDHVGFSFSKKLKEKHHSKRHGLHH